MYFIEMLNNGSCESWPMSMEGMKRNTNGEKEK